MFDCMPTKKIYLSFYKNPIKVKIGGSKNTYKSITKHYIHKIIFKHPTQSDGYSVQMILYE